MCRIFNVQHTGTTVHISKKITFSDSDCSAQEATIEAALYDY
jgi:hypothetical protein